MIHAHKKGRRITDKKRVDWLSNRPTIPFGYGFFVSFTNDGEVWNIKSLRQAIDAAIRQEEKK